MRTLSVLAGLAILSTPALAQEAPDLSPGCQQLTETLGDFLSATETGAIENLDNGCRFVDVYFSLGTSFRVRIEEGAIIAPDLEAALIQERQFEEADIRLSAVRIAPDLGSPVANYVSEMQVEPLDVSMRYQWNAETGETMINALSISSATLGSWGLTAKLSDIPDLGLARTGAVPVTGAVEELVIEADEQSLIRLFLAPILIYSLPFDEDPVPHIEAGKTEYIAAVRAVPEANMDDLSKNTLTALIDTFPRVEGKFTLSLLATDAPMRFEELFSWGPADVTRKLSSVQIKAAMADEL